MYFNLSNHTDFVHFIEVKLIYNVLLLGVGFPGGSVVKNSFAMQETWVQSLGWKDPLEKEIATHSSVLA